MRSRHPRRRTYHLAWTAAIDQGDGAERHLASFEVGFDGEDWRVTDDIATQVIWRGVRAKLIARRGEHQEAVALAEEGVALTEGTDSWDIAAGALLDLGEVLELAGRPDDARRATREALDLYEQKGIVPVIERVRGRLAELEAAGGS